ncbi:hypothetical protein BpHYR1_019171 [Brachionus plicatilis]|uniref:Uncharacterized protein n=1 Tax=Brachionus plicatilis TaxID=10195 RepID=A0A3M7TAH6_BRAPC|nr:hypothetical protein BpHYR1_019171 [Brachionus plicatilis]
MKRNILLFSLALSKTGSRTRFSFDIKTYFFLEKKNLFGQNKYLKKNSEMDIFVLALRLALSLTSKQDYRIYLVKKVSSLGQKLCFDLMTKNKID